MRSARRLLVVAGVSSRLVLRPSALAAAVWPAALTQRLPHFNSRPTTAARRCSFCTAASSTEKPHSAAPSSSTTVASAAPSAPSSASSAASSASDVSARYGALLHRLLTINTERKVRLGISTTPKLIAALGPAYSLDPDIPVIHVAGSNGKGSTTLKIARALQLHGLRVGVYTSPHVSSFRERIAVNGVPLSEEEFVELLPPMLDVASDRSDIPATFFELGTVLAFAHFRRAQVDVAVLEVGLGGRLDSTNVITAPELSVICSIALEHTAWLGPTLQHIAREKAGILKRGRPALLGSSVPLDVVQQVASEVSAGPIEQLTRRFDDYDKENSTLAARAVQLAVEHSPRLQLLLQQSTAGGLRKDLVAQGVRVRPPCRFQQLRWNAREQRAVYLDEDGSRSGALPWDSSNAYLQPSATLRVSDARRQPGEIDVVLDVCHNPTAFERLFEKLQHEYGSISTASQATVSPPIHAVVGFSSDKEFLPCLELLMRHCRSVHLVEADTPRAARAETVLQQAQEAGLPQRFPKCTLTITSRSPYDTLTRVLDGASEEASAPPSSATPPVVLCCGTFFIMSDVRRALRLPHPIDPVPINEQSLTRSEDDGGAQHAAANRR